MEEVRVNICFMPVWYLNKKSVKPETSWVIKVLSLNNFLSASKQETVTSCCNTAVNSTSIISTCSLFVITQSEQLNHCLDNYDLFQTPLSNVHKPPTKS